MNDSTTNPSAELEELILRALHGIADEAEGAALASHLAASSEAREFFTDHALLHVLLATEAKAGGLRPKPPHIPANLTSKGVIELPASQKGKTGLDNMIEEPRGNRERPGQGDPNGPGRGQGGGGERGSRPPQDGRRDQTP